ncbi:MAG TPA: hypothetical protein VH349_18555 [Ktedonobacterales bacterium]|jgi:hypothetical protein
MRDPRRFARAFGKVMVSNVWALGLIGVLTLAGCTLFGGPSATGDQSLTQIQWCDRKDISFRDASAASAAPLTNWADVKDQLGFTYYLPSSLPKGTCLVLAGGTIHDAVFNGGTFGITYNLPDSGPLSFSEAPKQPGASTNVQCVQSVQDAKTNICQGVVGDTNVTIASRLSTNDIQNYYSSLKGNLAWTPAVEPTVAPSPTVTATPKQ